MDLTKIMLILSLMCGLFLCKNKESNQDSAPVQLVSKAPKELPYFNTPDFAPTWLSSQNELEDLHKIPEFSFTDQLGATVTNKTFEGKIYIASFFFTTCASICLQMTDNMRKLQQMYTNDEDVLFLSHTVMPSVDTVEILKAYGERQEIDPNKWHLVTGDKDKIYQLAREAYFADDLYKETRDKDRFVHTENFILVDKKGHIRGVYNGTLAVELKRIQRHIAMLKAE